MQQVWQSLSFWQNGSCCVQVLLCLDYVSLTPALWTRVQNSRTLVHLRCYAASHPLGGWEGVPLPRLV